MIRGFWRALIPAGILVLSASPASAAWKKAESANFILYGESGDARLREHLALLEDYHDFVRLLTGIDDPPPPNKLNIYMVRGGAALRAVQDMPPGIVGVYLSSSSGIAAIVDETAGDDAQSTLLHEVAHHMMRQYRPLPYPAWYVEGFAEYVSTASFKKDVIEFGRPDIGRAYALVEGKWLPLDRVLFGGVPRDREEMAAFYAQSWLLAHYVLRSPEQRPRLTAYVAAMARGEDSRKAFAAAFPLPLPELEKELRGYTRKGMTYSRFKRKSEAAPPAVTITRLPPSADDLMIPFAKLNTSHEEDEALLASVRTLAAKHDDAFSRRVLAAAEALHGDGAKADALLSPLIAAAPADAELLYFKGMRHLRAARADDDGGAPQYKLARTAFAKAHKLDPNHWQTLLRYAEALRVDERFVSDNTINILLLAADLAPQTQEATMNAAQLLIARKRFAEAEKLVLPLTGDPHNAGLARSARSLLDQARAGAGGKPAPARE